MTVVSHLFFDLFQVDLNLLSSQDQEVHPVTPVKTKKSVSDCSSGLASGQLCESDALSTHHASVVQASSLVSIWRGNGCFFFLRFGSLFYDRWPFSR